MSSVTRGARPWPLVVTAALAAGTLTGCTFGDNRAVPITVLVPAADPALVAAATEMVDLIGYRGLEVRAVDDPVTALDGGAGLRIAVGGGRTCVECYRLDGVLGDPEAWVVDGGGLLGAQYGLAHALENLGFRFRHPFATYVPAVPRFDPGAQASLYQIHTPAVRVRGFQLHTLHPIEAYDAFWEPGEANLAAARRILDWTIKNRGNYVQWVGLDDINDPARHAPWQAHTRAILDAAHARGLRIGVNIQLYGQSNLQRAFDLWDGDDSGETVAEALAGRLPLITDGLPFDVYDLSFGEFFGAEPARFIADVNATAAALRQHAPAAEMHGLIHVGATHRVEYEGEDLLYYMLVKHADPAIVPDVHTVMFYDLYEDAGGAYHHDDFDEHRAYLLERMRDRKPAVYLPETAYWVAFDVSVPLALPLYVRTRWYDLDRLRADPAAMGGPLDGHILFSTGWEWGYWLHDYTALRASFETPGDYQTLIRDAYGEDLAPAVDLVSDLIELEHRTLLANRLVAYLAGRDGAIDIGRNLDIVSQPDRITFADLAELDGVERARFITNVLIPLDDLANRLDDLDARAAALALPDGRWTRELRDGLAITALRARFAATAYQLAVEIVDRNVDAYAARRAQLEDVLHRARAVVARRHGDLHHPDRDRLTRRGANVTFYPYGYLFMADGLCYWERELRQLEVMAELGTPTIPDCLF